MYPKEVLKIKNQQNLFLNFLWLFELQRRLEVTPKAWSHFSASESLRRFEVTSAPLDHNGSSGKPQIIPFHHHWFW
jgi:hypothetical protein